MRTGIDWVFEHCENSIILEDDTFPSDSFFPYCQELLARYRRKDLSPVTLYQAARFPVADVYLTQFFYGKSTVGTPTAITNFSHCSIADREIEAARAEPNADKQKAIWRTAQEKLLAEDCAVPLVESLVVWAWRDTLDLGYTMTGSLNLGPQITEKTRFVK